jgi:hypothetical protein
MLTRAAVVVVLGSDVVVGFGFGFGLGLACTRMTAFVTEVVGPAVVGAAEP